MGVLCHQRAMFVCVADRTLSGASNLPSALTSLKSFAHASLSRSLGPGVRNCEGLVMTKGLTVPTHGVGSSTGGSPSGHQ